MRKPNRSAANARRYALVITGQRSQITTGHVRDGLGRTVMLGEKCVSQMAYGSASDPGYDQSPFCGEDWDINRWTIRPPQRDGATPAPQFFGGPHPGGCLMAFCDASVTTIRFDIEPAVFRSLGNRADALLFDDSKFR